MRLIDADGSYALIAADNTDYSLRFSGGIISVMDKYGHIDCEFFSDDAPTIDAEPIAHGHWVQRWTGNEYRVFCSECRAEANEIADYELKYNFCPNCGANMDEVIDE